MKYVRDNRTQYDKIIREFKELGRTEITIGLHEDLGVHPSEDNKDSLSYAQIGTIQEYGATVIHPDGKPVDIPSRPFTARSFDANKSKIISDIVAMQKAMMAGQRMKPIAQNIGDKQALRQKQTMEVWSTPPNSARTVKHKGFNNPLVHTHAMIDGVKAKVS